MFSRREAAGDLGLVLRRRMAQHRVAKMIERVKEVEQENFDGRIYDDIGKNKVSLKRMVLVKCWVMVLKLVTQVLSVPSLYFIF